MTGTNGSEQTTLDVQSAATASHDHKTHNGHTTSMTNSERVSGTDQSTGTTDIGRVGGRPMTSPNGGGRVARDRPLVR
ncbi:hypothetical protein [Actinomadura sp. BRA 177]|uniref:hypothetical protein n=1 Tax=Actinomadura sp. BRA 177 TaxID=2745202 RepID=UPI0015953143|nr:hypothetical protein [Actinomadura sp. BRA 177]NVI87640.1 hypothetical protein [Actinomadura sp. BRA 177]